MLKPAVIFYRRNGWNRKKHFGHERGGQREGGQVGHTLVTKPITPLEMLLPSDSGSPKISMCPSTLYACIFKRNQSIVRGDERKCPCLASA